MELVNLINSRISFGQELEFFLRILVAGACGFAIGFERSKRLKGAGVRTHVVVACTAAIMMIVSKYGFADLTNAAGEFFAGTRGADPARIAAQVVSGVSFLGAGVIFKNGLSISGVTTAAGIWGTAAVGLAMGSGLYYIGLFSTVVLVMAQILMHHFTIGHNPTVVNEIKVSTRDLEGFQKMFDEKIEEWRAQIVESKVARQGDLVDIHIILRMYRTISMDEMIEFARMHDDVEAVEVGSV